MSDTVLCLNAGSSSIKFELFEVLPRDELQLAFRGQLEGIGVRPHLTANHGSDMPLIDRTYTVQEVPNVAAAMPKLTEWLREHMNGKLPIVIGHRLVFGGTRYSAPALIDDDCLGYLRSVVPLMPLHLPSELAPVELIHEQLPDMLQVAVFDTGFHRGHDELIQRLPIPETLHREGVLSYGFHGISYEFVAGRLKEIDPALANGRVVIAHLGSGCSMCALSGGRSVEASWGFSALDGLPMGTRPGRLDPGVILYLLQAKRMSVGQVQDLLYHECGLKGLSGVSSDVRELLASEDPRAQLALDSFSLRCARMVAELATVMGGLDGLVFTAGIGEHAAPLRANIGSRLSWLGVAIDAQANARHGPRISSSSSRLPCYVIATNEELMIARHALALVRRSARTAPNVDLPPPAARAQRYVRQSLALSQRNKENLPVTEPNTVTTVLPTSPKAPEESKEQSSKPAPSPPPELGKLTTDAMEYWRDFAQRSVLFLDILRRTGNQYEEMRARTINSVLIYDFEFVLRGDALPRPVNYALVRVIPPAGVKLDESKRPVIIIDPRAGQGPGIGGFKPVSEIGDAFKFGNPVYFIGFSAEPLEGQRVEDVARAHTVFIEKVRELHPKAPGGPFVVGNCQAGWHAMMAACMRPDLVGPILIAGAPLSYWAGVRGKNPMRYLGGVLGGSWPTRLTSGLSNGIFDGSWLVANFDSGKPSNTLWGKQYNVWANPEQQESRYLQFEKWWSDFVVMRGEEMQYIVDNLFIGNKLSTAQIVTSDGIRLDLRDVKSPIICFCSHGDNITPPQQALDWILDCYENVDEIRRAGQTILYCLNQKVGHLAIFVGTEVAAKEHAGFMNYMELIDAMPPGLYEIVIAQKPGPAAGAGDVGSYDLSIEERGLGDIRALGCNSLEDEREFAAVARVSELTNAFYQNYLEPWVKAMISPQLALATRELNPLRLRYSTFSDQNPLMRALAPLAEQVRTERTVPASDNPFVAMQEQFSRAMTQALDLYGNARDWLEEQMFHGIYGSPVVQALCGISQNDGPPRQRPGQSPATRAALEAEIRRLKGRFAEGDALDAAARIVVYISMTHHRVEASQFDAVQRLLAAHPEVSVARFKEALRDQWAILSIDERAAIDSLPQLLPANAGERRALMDMVNSVFATDRVDADVQRRLREIGQLLLVETDTGTQTTGTQTTGTQTAGTQTAGTQTRTKRKLERAEES